MKKNNIINTAIKNLNRNPQIRWNWDNVPDKEMDGKITIRIDQTVMVYFQVNQALRQRQVASFATFSN